MLRKKGPSSSGSSVRRGDDDVGGNKGSKDKGGKIIKRQSEQRFKSTVLVLAFFAFIGFCALTVFKDSTDFDPFGSGGGLRTRTRNLLKKKKKTADSVLQNPSHLPPDSIYHLDVDDCDGNKVSLEQYGGMVSLIVNVASK